MAAEFDNPNKLGIFFHATASEIRFGDSARAVRHYESRVYRFDWHGLKELLAQMMAPGKGI